MSLTSSQEATFLSSAGVSAADSKILFASIFISLIFIFVMMILIGLHRNWSKEGIDTGEYFARAIGLCLLIVLAVYIAN